jgi:hypothetical protein
VSNTRTSQGISLTSGYQLDKVQKKLALQLWVKLQHSEPDQRFNVLLTLKNKPGNAELEQLQDAGLEIAAFHQEQPETLIPGVISKLHLEKKLIHNEFVRYVEGVPLPA